MSNLKLGCPSCGGSTFKSSREIKTYNDFVGASCDRCGRKITDADIKRQAADLATALIKKTFKGGTIKLR